MFTVVVATSLRTTNKQLSKLKSIISCGDYKKTWQEVSNTFIYYLYKYI